MHPTLPAPTRAAPAGVILTGINYWPEESGSAPYTTQFAEHLARQGSRVDVVTGMPYYPHWRVFDGYRGGLTRREIAGGVRIHRYRQYVPVRQSALRRALFEGSFLLNGLQSLRLPRPDLVIGSVPSLGGGVLAATLARRYRVPLGLVIQDLVGHAAAQSGVPGGGRVARATRAVEGWVARAAARIGIVSERFRPYLEGLGVTPERIVHLPNWAHIPPPATGRTATRARLGWSPEQRIVLHAGNIGYKQGLERVVDAARLAAPRDPGLRFVLLGDGNQRAMLERRAAGLSNLCFMDPIPAGEFPDVLAAADILLVNERATAVDMSLPSKLTSYYTAGRPIVAAVPLDGGTAAEVRRSGAGLVVPAADPAALLDVLQQFAADPTLGDRLGAAGRVHAERHLSRAAGLARCDQFIHDILRGGDATLAAVPFGDAA